MQVVYICQYIAICVQVSVLCMCVAFVCACVCVSAFCVYKYINCTPVLTGHAAGAVIRGGFHTNLVSALVMLLRLTLQIWCVGYVRVYVSIHRVYTTHVNTHTHRDIGMHTSTYTPYNNNDNNDSNLYAYTNTNTDNKKTHWVASSHSFLMPCKRAGSCAVAGLSFRIIALVYTNQQPHDTVSLVRGGVVAENPPSEHAWSPRPTREAHAQRTESSDNHLGVSCPHARCSHAGPSWPGDKKTV